MRVFRVHHPGAGAASGEIRLSREESHHVVRVLRLREGDALRVFDGSGREWEAELVTAERGAVTLRLGARLEGAVDPVLDVRLYQALCRPDRMEWIIQKGTEIGIRALCVVRTERSETVRLPDSRLERWRRIAVEACKQSGRRTVPEISGPEDLPRGSPGAGVAGMVLDPRAPRSALNGLLAGPAPASVGIVVGPESGLTRDETAGLERVGWIRVGLGPRVLRTETAGAVAAAVVLHAWGDLGTELDC